MKVKFVPGGFGAYGVPYSTNSRYTVKERHDLLALVPSGLAPLSLLEMGCANGDNLRFFARALGVAPERVVGVDLCKSTESDYSGMVFHHASAEAFFARCSELFDLIILSDVLEHIYNPWNLLRTAKKNLAAGGVILVSVPNLQNLNYARSVILGEFTYQATGLFDETHIRFFTQASLGQYLRMCGYHLLRFDWRPDLSLLGLREDVQRALASSPKCPVDLGNAMVLVTRDNIDQIFGQQILAAATHEDP